MELLAQAPDSLWSDVIRAMAGNGLWVFLSVLFLLWTIEGLSKRYWQHRERIAMIEMGMNPSDWHKDSAGDPCKAALELRVGAHPSPTPDWHEAPASGSCDAEQSAPVRETAEFRGTG